MRSLAGVCEQQRVIRAARAASLEDAYVYIVTADLEVVACEFIKTTPKYVKFDTGLKAGTREDAPPWYAYAELEPFMAGEQARVVGGPSNHFFHLYYAWRHRHDAEQHAEHWRQWRARWQQHAVRTA